MSIGVPIYGFNCRFRSEVNNNDTSTNDGSEREREREGEHVDVTQSYVCRGLWANGMQVSGGDGGSLPARRTPGSIGISIFMGLSRLRATVPRGT